MGLAEYQRKRRFNDTPEPSGKLEDQAGHRFVVQKHHASRLHYDFRLEMEGVLKSWAVPKGPSLDAADKRLAMMVEDHPVSYIHFEGIIPPGNYGAGTVMVWDTGTWEPEGEASQMLAKGDLKFRLNGVKLKGSFVLAHMKSRRPGSKGNEWLLIKHRDEFVVPGYDIDEYDLSVLSHRSLAQIAEDEGSAEWQSSRPAAVSAKNSWLEESIRKRAAGEKKTSGNEEKGTGVAASSGRKREPARKSSKRTAKVSSFVAAVARTTGTKAKATAPPKRAAHKGKKSNSKKAASSTPSSPSVEADSKANSEASPRSSKSALEVTKGAVRATMPTAIHPMLATLVDEPFSDSEWLYEIKWDGYRALAFLDNGNLRLVSRNQNEMTAQFPELASLPRAVVAGQSIIDGEIVALDEEGRSSFSLMQQRTGIGRTRAPSRANQARLEGPKNPGRRVAAAKDEVPIQYYAFDLLYLDGFDLRRVDLEQRKRLLSELIAASPIVRYSEHFSDGKLLYEAAKQRGLEGIVAKRRRSCYVEKRSREWLKIKITQRQECVIGGYTDPKGSREHFGSLILGLHDEKGRLIHVGQAGSGFTHKTHEEMWRRLQPLVSPKSPFYGKVETQRLNHWVRPELVAEIKFIEWTHEGQSGSIKMRAPVFEGLREDKSPQECAFERAKPARLEKERAERAEEVA